MCNEKDIYKTRATLLEKIRDKHDDEAWEEFVYYYEKFIYVICRSMNLNHHDTEEVVQKVLLLSWNKLPEFKYDGKKKFRGWLCQMTKYTVKDFYKSVKCYNNKKNNIAINNESQNIISSLPEIEKIAEKEWETYIASLAFMNIKTNFSDKVINIFEKLLEGGTPSSIAKEMQIPPNTISVYKKRVSATLRDEIKRLKYELG